MQRLPGTGTMGGAAANSEIVSQLIICFATVPRRCVAALPNSRMRATQPPSPRSFVTSRSSPGPHPSSRLDAIHALRILGARRPPRDPPQPRSISSSDRDLRCAAFQSVEKIGAEAASPRYCPSSAVLTDPDGVARYRAAQLLGTLGHAAADPETLLQLRHLLKDPDRKCDATPSSHSAVWRAGRCPRHNRVVPGSRHAGACEAPIS